MKNNNNTNRTRRRESLLTVYDMEGGSFRMDGRYRDIMTDEFESKYWSKIFSYNDDK